MEKSSGDVGRTWREDFDLSDRLARDRPPQVRPVRTRRLHRHRTKASVLLPDVFTSRLLRQATIAAIAFLLVAAGLRLPFGLGARLERTLSHLLLDDTNLERVAGTVRGLAEQGRQWAATELGTDILPVSGREGGDVAPGDANAEPVFWVWPLDGEVLSQFGWRRPVSGGEEFHRGVDIAGEAGAPVVAAASGTVAGVGEDPDGYGVVVEIRHEGGWVTRYARLETASASAGDAVRQGDVIGVIGASGNAERPHLHFEMLLDGSPVDPEPKLRRGKDGS